MSIPRLEDECCYCRKFKPISFLNRLVYSSNWGDGVSYEGGVVCDSCVPRLVRDTAWGSSRFDKYWHSY